MKPIKYVSYYHGGNAGYGILDGEVIHELNGCFLAGAARTGKAVRLAEARLLPPVEPSKVLAIGLNYKSHLGERPARPFPGVFIKLPSSIIGTEDSIIFPPEAENVHYEGVMVLVIG